MDTRPADLCIGFPSESGTERRTILTPGLARALIEAGFGVVTEPGIGAGVFTGDEQYAAAGVRLTEPGRVWSAPLLLRYKSPDPANLRHLHPEQHIAALFHAEGDVGLLTALRDCGATAWSYEFVAEHSRFPLGRPGGQIAGVQAVLAGRTHCRPLPGGACCWPRSMVRRRRTSWSSAPATWVLLPRRLRPCSART